MNSIGFIGLGNMGLPMACAIADGHYPLLCYDIDEHAMAKAQALSLHTVSSIDTVFIEADVVFFMVNTYEQIVDCLFSKSGNVNNHARGLCIVICSTILPCQIQLLQQRLSGKDIILIDAPVSGGVDGANGRALTTIFSGSEDTFGVLHKLFLTYSKKVFNVGKTIGQAQAIKAINNLLYGINIVAMAEAFSIAEKNGINLEILMDIITCSSGNSYVLERHGCRLLKRDFSPKSTLEIQKKDTNNAVLLAKTVGAYAPLADLCAKMFSEAEKVAEPNENPIAVIKLYEQKSNGK